MRDEDYNQAVKYYRLAAKCSAKAGDTQKEKREECARKDAASNTHAANPRA